MNLRDTHSMLVKENLRLKGSRDAIINMAEAKVRLISELNEKQRNVSDAILITQKLSEGLQTGVVKRFEDLLTRGVRQIFQKEYTVLIEFSTSGNTLNADFFITLPDGKKVNLAKGEGGGLRDLVAVLQRILYLILEPSRPARILFLDENMKALDVGRAPAAFYFIVKLCKELDIQIIFITHQQAAIDREMDGMRVVRLGA